MGRLPSLRNRVVENLRRLVKDRPRGWAAAFCERYSVWPSTLARTLSGAQAPTLELLEQIAEMEGLSPLVLMASPEEELKPVSTKESKLLRYVRPPLMPASVLDALLAFLEFYSAEPPEERELRNLVNYAQKLSDGQRNRVLAYMVMLHEGVPRDLQVALRLPAEGGDSEPPRKRSEKRTGRRDAP
jgi:transcriptional regulator with XRE-family HTH domain